LFGEEKTTTRKERIRKRNKPGTRGALKTAKRGIETQRKKKRPKRAKKIKGKTRKLSVRKRWGISQRGVQNELQH